MFLQPQHKAGFVSVDGATAEDDYTSQIGKDLQKRRSWLFELTLPNQMIYLLQAPNGTQRAQWSVLEFTTVHIHFMDVQNFAIKGSRFCDHVWQGTFLETKRLR